MEDDDDLGLFAPQSASRQRATAGRRQAPAVPQTNVAVTGTRTLQFDSNSELDPPSHTSLSIGIPDSAAALPLATGTLSLDGDPQPLGSWQHDQANVKIPQGSSDYRRGTADPQPTVTDRDVRGSTMELVSAADNPSGPSRGSRKWDIDAMLFGDDDDASKNVANPPQCESAATFSDATASIQASPQQLGLSRRKQAQLEATERRQRDKYAEEKEVDVGQLQSLEDAEQEGITNKVADAPKVHMTRNMNALHDLEGKGIHRVRQHLADQFGPELDFSVLLSCLLPEDQLQEKEEYWDENLLLTEIVSELETLKESGKAEVPEC